MADRGEGETPSHQHEGVAGRECCLSRTPTHTNTSSPAQRPSDERVARPCSHKSALTVVVQLGRGRCVYMGWDTRLRHASRHAFLRSGLMDGVLVRRDGERAAKRFGRLVDGRRGLDECVDEFSPRAEEKASDEAGGRFDTNQLGRKVTPVRRNQRTGSRTRSRVISARQQSWTDAEKVSTEGTSDHWRSSILM